MSLIGCGVASLKPGDPCGCFGQEGLERELAGVFDRNRQDILLGRDQAVGRGGVVEISLPSGNKPTKRILG